MILPGNEVYLMPKEGSAPVLIGTNARMLVIDDIAEPVRSLASCMESVSVRMTMTAESARELWKVFERMYRLDALRHQLKNKGRPGWKRQPRKPMTRWTV